jgi:hypothetical protein
LVYEEGISEIEAINSLFVAKRSKTYVNLKTSKSSRET